MSERELECSARLMLTSEKCFSEKFNELLREYEGSEVWRKGDKIGKTILKHKENGWEIASDKFSTLQEALNQLICKVGERVSYLREIADTEDLETELSIHITMFDWNFPEIFFDVDHLAWCSALRCCIDVDVIKSL